MTVKNKLFIDAHLKNICLYIYIHIFLVLNQNDLQVISGEIEVLRRLPNFEVDKNNNEKHTFP